MDTWTGAQSQGQRDPAGGPANEDRRLRFTHDGTSDPEVPGGREIAPAQAPAAFDNQTNGFNIQGPAFVPHLHQHAGNGFVEAISSTTLLAIRDAQPVGIRGTANLVPVLEARGRGRLGRFGWKNQHASLESFAADAYLNEMGITTPTFLDENSASGHDVRPYDPVADPEDDGVDVVAFANFMRATKAPPRGAIDATVNAGEALFRQVGCARCHVGTIRTAPAGTRINGGQFIVPPALGDKFIHPYSDFLLHELGTGDGIPITPNPEDASTANQIRTAPLWGLRTRNRLMHDGLSFTREDAIRRHGGQGAGAAC